ncbi:MAG: subclass B3 metallo-beta-lactamase, partial [Acidobacteriia bacterium]|nr:subclass B3 metallo-beta-lactamase [Terriglobia bacterium]
GTKGLSTYLITTSQGNILINSSFERTVPKIKAAIEQLGFQYRDIKILLGSHAHGDHMDGNFLVKEQTAAKVYVMKGDDDLIRNGMRGSKPCVVDKVLKDGEKITLGGATLTALLTPGHTKGCTTWTMQVNDEGKSRLAVIVGSPNVNPGYILVNNRQYPEIAEDFAKSFRVWKSLPCEIFLGAHGEYYGMAAKHKRWKADPSLKVWVDPEGYKAYIADREQAYLAELARQRKQ